MVSSSANTRPIEILMAEDNPADARLALEGFKTAVANHNITVIEDGEQVMEYLDRVRQDPNQKTPDLILLDLNSQRRFFADGDTVSIKGWCDGDGYRVGFGDVRSKILSVPQ